MTHFQFSLGAALGNLTSQQLRKDIFVATAWPSGTLFRSFVSFRSDSKGKGLMESNQFIWCVFLRNFSWLIWWSNTCTQSSGFVSLCLSSCIEQFSCSFQCLRFSSYNHQRRVLVLPFGWIRNDVPLMKISASRLKSEGKRVSRKRRPLKRRP